MDALLLGPRCVAAAARRPQIVVLLYVATLIPALIVVAPYFRAADAALAHHPDATFLRSQALDGDLERQLTAPQGPLLLAVLLVGLAWTFVTGGVLALEAQERAFAWTSFMAACGRFFLRTLRVNAVLALVLTACSWAYDALAHQLFEDHLRVSGDPWRGLGLQSALDAGYAAGVCILAFASMLACADMVFGDRHSALLAWLRAPGSLLRHPLRALLGFLGVLVLMQLVVAVAGWLVAQMIEARGEVVWGLVIGQVAIVWIQLCGVAFLHVAAALVRRRAFAGNGGDSR